MSTVAIIGAGELGAATACALAARDRVRRVLLVDDAAAVAAGKALDILQSGAVHGFHVRVEGTGDPCRIAGSDVCIVAGAHGAASGEWEGDSAFALMSRLLPAAGDAPIVFAGPAQSELLGRLARELRVPRMRLIGSAPEALVSAVTAMVALEARCSPTEVALAVLGAPQPGLVVPWSEASLGGYAIDRVLSQAQLARLQARTALLWPPGPQTLGAAAARVADAVLHASRRSFSVLTELDGEFGVRNRVGALPVRLSERGILHTRVPELTTRERVQVETSLMQGGPPSSAVL